MRFVWAVAAFVLAALMIVAGIAQRTVFQGPKTETAAIAVSQAAPYTVIDGAVLGQLPGTQTLRVQGDGTIFAAYGRTADMKAWLVDSDYNEVTRNSAGDLITKSILPTPAPSPDATPPDDAATAPAEGEVPAEQPLHDPVGSDLWLDEFAQEGLLIAPLQLPETMSVLIASDGVEPAPAQISVSWPIVNNTPWAGPLVVGGSILMVVGAVLYILALRHVRRSRGPRRKGLPLPVTEPIDLAVEGADKGVISAAPTRRSISGGRAFAVIPAVAVSALLFSGCSADAWPTFAGSPTPTPTATVIVPEGQQSPAVTEAQAQRILTRIAETVAAADEAGDKELLATRMEGAPLAVRETNYDLKAAVPDYAGLSAVPAKPLKIVLPQSYDQWPRTFMTVVDDPADKVSIISLMRQDDPWSEYKLSYVANLEASTELPDLAAVYVGATQVPPESSFLVMAPDELAAAYADVLTNGDDSEFLPQFDTENDMFRIGIEEDRQNRLDKFNETADSTGSLSFSTAVGAEPPMALATLESGAIVAVNLEEIDTVKPTDAGAVIKLGDNPTVKALVGVDESATGVTTTYSDQLFFYVPGQGSTEKIRLLGYSSHILNAKVIP